MLKCITKPDQNYNAMLLQHEGGGKGDSHKSSLPEGLFELHLYIEQTRGLVNPSDSGALNPIIRVNAFGQKRHSSVKKNIGTGMTYWGEHMFFIKKFDSPIEFETEKMKLEVYDNKMIGSDGMVGEFEIDLLNIYHSENHSFFHKWVALSNFEKGLSEIKGYILISANVITAGDSPVELKDYVATDSKTLGEPKLLLPPHLQTKPWQLKISLIKAENLVKLDLIGSIDSYVQFEYGGASIKTETIKDNRNPIWGKHVFLPFSEPAVDDWVVIRIFDHDAMDKDDVVGGYSLNKNEIVSGKFSNYFWLNIYGAQVDGDPDISETMNSHSQLGTLWKGRILLAITAMESEKPKLGFENIDPKIMESISKSVHKSWVMVSEILCGENFPEKKEKYSVEIRWGNKEIFFNTMSAQRGIWEWYERKKEVFDFPYTKPEELPDVFVYVKQDNKRFSYIRFEAKEFLNKFNKEAELYYFKVSKEKFPNLREDQAGYVKFRICLGSDIDMKAIENIDDWNKPIDRPFFKYIDLLIHLYNGKNLIPADDDGNSDPFVTFSYFGLEVKSEILQKTLNPIWNCSYKLRIPFISIHEMLPLNLRLYDSDDDENNELIGYTTINLESALRNKGLLIDVPSLAKPQWYNLQMAGSEAGKILIAFNIFTDSKLYKEINLLPGFVKFHFKIRVLGVRGLQKVGLQGIKKPIVIFNVGSLRDPKTKIDLPEKNIMIAEAKDMGSDANFSTILSFSIDLPKDSQLWPNMSCLLRNQIWKGKMEPIMGTFSIDLKECADKSRLKNEKKLEKAHSQILIPIKSMNNLNVSKSVIPNNSNNLNLSASKSIIQNNSKALIKEPFSIKKPSQIFESKNYIEFNDEQISSSPQQNKELNVFQTYKEPEVGSKNSMTISKLTSIYIKAKYQKDPNKPYPVEIEVPDRSLYMGLGYDGVKDRLDPEKTKKHYRLFVTTPLEESIYMDKDTFDEYVIKTGQRAHKNSFFDKMMGFDNSLRAIGLFKCWIEILSEQSKMALEKSKAKPLDSIFQENSINSLDKSVVQSQKNKSFTNKPLDIDKDFMISNSVVVRVHIIDVFSLVQLDSDSPPSPYIQLRLGKQIVHNESENVKDSVNASFCKTFELRTVLPGSCLLQIQIMDYKPLLEDPIIGETTIDLENRFFSKKWRKLLYIPIETREIYSPICSIPTGQIRLFVEIISVNDKFSLQRIWDLKPKPPQEFEIRCVVWEIEGCPSSDWTDTSDYFVTGTVGDVMQKTDTHWQAQKGNGSFNWRLIFPITFPAKDNTITFQVFDSDIIGGDDYISAVTMDFSQQAQEAFENDISVKVFGKHSVNIGKEIEKKIGGIFDKEEKPKEPPKKEEKLKDGEKFDIDLENIPKEGYSVKPQGKIMLSFEIMPGKMAKSNPVGKGRSEPNASPYLPAPTGRFKLSLNPLAMFSQLFGPKMRAKICCCLCFIICLMLIFMLIPIIAGNIATDIVKKIF